MVTARDRRGDPGYDLARVTAYRLAVLSNRLTLWSARVYRREFGISVLEWRVLAILAELGPSLARDIAEFSVLDKSNVSRAVSRLTARGLVEQAGHPVDGRSRILTLTAKGKALHRRIAARSRQREDALFEGFSPVERSDLAALLERLDRSARALLRTTES